MFWVSTSSARYGTDCHAVTVSITFSLPSWSRLLLFAFDFTYLSLHIDPPLTHSLHAQSSMDLNCFVCYCEGPIYSISMMSGSVMFRTSYCVHQIYSIIADQHCSSAANVGLSSNDHFNIVYWYSPGIYQCCNSSFCCY